MNKKVILIQDRESANWSEKLEDHKKEIRLLLDLLDQVNTGNSQKDVKVLVEKFQNQLTNCLQSINEVNNQLTKISSQQQAMEHSPELQRPNEFRESEEKVAEILEKVLEELRTELARFANRRTS